MSDFKAKIIAEIDTTQVEQKINKLDGKKVKFGVDGGNAKKEVEKVDNSIKSATKSTKTFGAALKTSAKLGAAYSITSQAFQAIREAASKAKEAVQEFDAAVMDLRMATGGTYTEVSNLVKGYNALGKEIGATTKEVSSGADSWLRQGHSISKTNTLIRDSMILSKVANLESADATQYLTSAMKGYNVEVEDVIGIVDKLTAVDLVSATEAGGLAEAMSRTAESADMAGVSMDKLLGYLAATGEVTQKSMSSIGESFKTIFTRMGDIKSGKLQFIDEDGTAESLSDVETVLNNLGIKLRDSNNEFRNFGDVLDDVGEAWDNYSTVQKAAISKAFAETRQSENFKVLMENYSQATSYMETSINSEGTAEQKFEAYLDSLEAKTKSLQASFESLAINTFSSEIFGGIIDATSSVVTFLDKTNLLKGTLVGLTVVGAIKGFTMLATGITNASIRLNEFNSALKLVKAGNIGENEVQMLAKMTSNLSQSQLKAILSLKALSAEQRIAILTAQGLSKSEAEATLSSMGLATAEGAATTSTFTLSGALKGLWATLKANPFILVVTAIASVISIISTLKQKTDEANQAAADKVRESVDAYNSESQSLTDLINKYKELAKSDKRDLATQEEIKNIQQEIVKLTGDQNTEIDLVNGSLDDQIDKLNTIKGILADEKLDTFEANYQNASEKTDSSTYNYRDGSYVDDIFNYLGLQEVLTPDNIISFDYWGDNEGRDKAIDIINKEWQKLGYGSASTEVEPYLIFWDSYSQLEFDSKLNASERINALDAAINALKNNTEGFDYYNNETFGKLVAIRNDMQGLIDNETASAKDLLNNLIVSSVKNGKNINSFDEYIDYRNEIISQITDKSALKSAIERGVLDESIINESIDSYFGSLDKYSSYYKTWQNQNVASNSDALDKIRENYKKFILDDLPEAQDGVSFPREEEFIAANKINEFDAWISGLSQEDKKIIYDISVNTDTATYSLKDWQSTLEYYKKTGSASINDISADVNSFVSAIPSIQSIIFGQTTGKSISLEDFNSEELKDYTSALEYCNGTLQLNSEKVNQIIKEKSDEKKAILNTNKVISQQKYLENASQIEKLRQKIKEKNFAEGESEESIRNNIDALLIENQTLKSSCDKYNLMISSLDEATGAYQNWLNAQNASESGDMFDDTINAINHINDTLNNSESELFGRVGRVDYQAAIDLIIPDSIDKESSDEVNSYLNKIHDLFLYDDDGKRSGLNIANFIQKSMDEGLMVFDQASDSYIIAGQKTMEDFATGLGLSLPLVQAMFGEMEEFGAEFSWADEAKKTIGDIAMSATESANALSALPQNQDLSIRLDVSDLETTEQKIAVLDETISSMNAIKSRVNVDPSEIEDANNIIEYCVKQQQQLSSPIIMSVDTSAVSENTSAAVQTLQDFQTACNELELNQKLGLNTDEAQENVNILAEQVRNINPQILSELSIDTSSVESIKQTINAISGNQLISIGIDDSAIIGWEASNLDRTVTFHKTSTEVDTYDPADLDRTVTFHKISTEVDMYNPRNLSRTITYTYKTINPPNSGVHELNGTAHLTGTAMAGGNWGTAYGGKKLVGELGREIVVNPHTGKWYTVGDYGAEFVDVPKGSIVFNHKQTESLLSNGYVSGRASALVGGTAMVTGGISADVLKYQNTSTSSSKTSSSSNKSSGKSSKSSGNSSSKSSNNSSESSNNLETIDWIEIAISRLERAISRLKKTAENTYKALKVKLGATADEITKVNQEIALQQKAYSRYTQEANSVGLSSDLAAKVQNGTIDINQYNEDTRNLISDYQKWFEAALDCSDAIDDLHESLASLYEDNFNNIQEDFENQLKLAEHLTNQYQNGIDLLEARGYLESTKYYSAMQDVTKGNIAILNNELAALEQSFSDAMNSGEIEYGSSAWFEMQIAINGVKEEIAEANVELAEYAKTMREIEWGYFDYTQERISQITQEADFLINLLSNNDLHTDKGQLTDEGMSTMGLHAQNYNVYMAQADAYAEEILNINKELAKDPYNTELIERREELLELQQDSILAAEDEKQAIVSLVEEGIALELESLQDLIDTYTNALDSAKDWEFMKPHKFISPLYTERI